VSWAPCGVVGPRRPRGGDGERGGRSRAPGVRGSTSRGVSAGFGRRAPLHSELRPSPPGLGSRGDTGGGGRSRGSGVVVEGDRGCSGSRGQRSLSQRGTALF